MQHYPGGAYKEHYYVEEVVEEDYRFNEGHHYDNKGSYSGMQMKHQPKHNYNHSVHGYENFKDGRDGYSVQHSEAFYEKEQYNDSWNDKNECYSGYGGKQHLNADKYHGSQPHHVGMIGGNGHGHGHGHGQGTHQYGTHQNQHYGEHKPYWNSKGIKD